MQTTLSTPSAARSGRLRNLLAQDPANEGLLLALAGALYDEGDYSGCDTALTGLPQGDMQADHLRGLVALSLSRFDDALAVFSALSQSVDDTTIRYNMAYALAMLDRHDEALEQLDDMMCAEVAAASPLRLRVLHRLGRFDDAVAFGRQRLLLADDHQLRGLLSMILFDQGDLHAAGTEAARAPESVEGATTAGLLALETGETTDAARLFEFALERNPHSGRAMLGRGLAMTSNGTFAQAADTLESAATMLRNHSGAWVTAGWARLMQGDLQLAKANFRRAMDMDPGFSEACGGLAMVLLQEDQQDDARHYARAALRLDPASLSGQYVTGLLDAAQGRPDQAKKAFTSLMNQKLGESELSLGSTLARYRRAP